MADSQNGGQGSLHPFFGTMAVSQRGAQLIMWSDNETEIDLLGFEHLVTADHVYRQQRGAPAGNYRRLWRLGQRQVQPIEDDCP